MKGRGTRTIDSDKLMQVTRTANSKTHFVIVDAVGATKSKKTDSRPLERQPTVPLKDLLGAITMGVEEEDLFLSLANRLIRLEKQITDKEKEKLLEYSSGKNLKQITKELLNAFDPDEIEKIVQVKVEATPIQDRTPAQYVEAKKEAQQELIQQAATTFNGTLNEYIDNVRKEHEQIIDHINIDTVTKSEWDSFTTEKANETIRDFTEYLEKNKDEIQALSIFYNQPYNRRNITFKMIKEVMEKIKLEKPMLAPDYVWNAYCAVDSVETRLIASLRCPKNDLTALVSLIRRACGIDGELKPFDRTINENFQNWIFKQNAGQHNRFTQEQMDWLRMIKDHVVSSYHIEMDDLDYTPFDAQGGRGRMYQLFGKEMNEIINELNEVLAA
jgi:type I restriction enzyme R subunit